MMEGLRQYVITVTAAALICGIIAGLVKKNSGGALIRMVCGLVLAFTVLRPIVGLKLDDVSADLLPDLQTGEDMAAQGEKITEEAMEKIIKSQTEAYILDKAAALGMSLTAEVLLGEEAIPVPVGVILSGACSPYARSELSEVIEKDLGIPKENQLWTG